MSEAREEAERRWPKGWDVEEGTWRDGAVNGFILGAEWADQGKPQITAPCARCGVNLVVTSDAQNTNLDVCGDCGVQIGRDELGPQITANVSGQE